MFGTADPTGGQSSPVWSCSAFTDLICSCFKNYFGFACVVWSWEGLVLLGNMLIIFISWNKCPGFLLSVSSQNSSVTLLNAVPPGRQCFQIQAVHEIPSK